MRLRGTRHSADWVGATPCVQPRVPRVRAAARWQGKRTLHGGRTSDRATVAHALHGPAFTQLRYANNSNYKNDEIITREVFVGKSVIDEFKRIVVDSEVSMGAAS